MTSGIRLRSLAPGFLVIVLVLSAGCASHAAPPQDLQGRFVSKMTANLTFEAPEIYIPKGGTVAWTNTGSIGHDVNAYPPDNGDYPDWTSAEAPPSGVGGRLVMHNETVQYTFQKSGEWTIWCHTHHEQRMKQIVHVGR